MRYVWSEVPVSEAKLKRFSAELGIEEIVARLLLNRGITDSEDAEKFLYPALDDLHDPFLMLGMKESVARVSEALERQEKILIYGDYDVDGITATVVMRRALEMLGGTVSYYIPRRLSEGYGLKKRVVEEAKSQGIDLILTVDSGIRDIEVVQYARNLGLDLIITDHHLPDTELPAALAILNPHQHGCGYPYKDLAAVGVALKLVQALFEQRDKGDVVHHFLKMVAIGTVADMVPLTGENRVIVRFGLAGLSQPYNVGLQALLNGAGVGPTVDQFDIGFKLAPRINAFTRMGGGSEIVDLFSATDLVSAQSFVDEMNRKNIERRQEEDRIFAEIEERYQTCPEEFAGPFLLVSGEGWHRGVIGNVAARLVDRFYRPALVLSLDGDTLQGSGRSIPGFHLLQALTDCADVFEKFGGHAQAVGCTLRGDCATPDELQKIRTRLENHAASCLTEEQLIPSLTVDALIAQADLNFELCEALEPLAPFGIGNPVPTFVTRDLLVERGPWILKEKHLKWQAHPNGVPVDVIWWRNGEAADLVNPGARVDVAYHVTREAFRGNEKLLLTVKDMRQS